MLSIRRIFPVLLAMLAIAAFFMPSLEGRLLFNGEYDRSIAHIWNFGHIAFFCALGFAVFRKAPATPFSYHSLIVLLMLFALGICVELLQYFVGRNASLQDVLYNGLGLLAGYSLVFVRRNIVTRYLLTAVLSGIIFLHLPAIQDFMDEREAHKSFPILADFKKPGQLSRFHFKNAHAKLANSRLHIGFSPNVYANVELLFFPRSWSEFNTLNLKVFTPAGPPLPLSCRIHDQLHSNSDEQHYDDRFNQRFIIPEGNHSITIDLQEVEEAPKNRAMDMHAIKALVCFTDHVSEYKKLRIEKIWLSKTPIKAPDLKHL